MKTLRSFLMVAALVLVISTRAWAGTDITFTWDSPLDHVTYYVLELQPGAIGVESIIEPIPVSTIDIYNPAYHLNVPIGNWIATLRAGNEFGESASTEGLIVIIMEEKAPGTPTGFRFRSPDGDSRQ